ncbi:putative bifunctional diguanylate cyclase/phosphodiesterase [Bradyrhizobium sp. STM 3557]|uniref:putative bifunctional diguanylate cyclase/phosphodiesterase n=1 Tax=Bradyrhizobium sp. STM 3557 TaxID=578920 RepID=UPI003890FD1A
MAVLAYDPGAPVTFDPMLTIASLMIAIGGFGAAFALAAGSKHRFASVLAGTMVGVTIAAMHYVGMAAYHISGIVHWEAAYVALSIIHPIVLGIVTLQLSARIDSARAQYTAASALVLAIVALHFTGMAAVSVIPLTVGVTDDAVLQGMAVAIAGVSLFIVGIGAASHMIDQRSRSETTLKLEHMALTDPLTGLPNGRRFIAHLEAELAKARKSASRLAVLMLDLNRFKEINDLRGHQAGDQALKLIASRLERCLGTGELAARVGGDGFAAVKRVTTRTELLAFLERLAETLSEPLQIGDFTADVGASIGVAVFPEDGATQEALVGNADFAMYRAKADPSKTVCFYESKLGDAVRERQILARELSHAVALNQLELHFQVQVSIPQSTVCGYEVLLRWRHPRHGLVPPLEFIKLAEETGAIIEIGEWVLREACRRAAVWRTPYRIAVNLSPVQFEHPDLPRVIHQILLETGLPPARLELEITESAIIDDKAGALHTLRQIRALGIAVSLDDFGTGYSSFETLRAFPFDKIKLDRLFMTEVETSPQALAIVRAVLTLGKSLGVTILAEGVETQSQLEILLSEGCDEAQGYLLGRPRPHDELFTRDGIERPSSSKPQSTGAPVAAERVVA